MGDAKIMDKIIVKVKYRGIYTEVEYHVDAYSRNEDSLILFMNNRPLIIPHSVIEYFTPDYKPGNIYKELAYDGFIVIKTKTLFPKARKFKDIGSVESAVAEFFNMLNHKDRAHALSHGLIVDDFYCYTTWLASIDIYLDPATMTCKYKVELEIADAFDEPDEG